MSQINTLARRLWFASGALCTLYGALTLSAGLYSFTALFAVLALRAAWKVHTLTQECDNSGPTQRNPKRPGG